MKKPFKLYEKDGQQILVTAVCDNDEICIRYSVGFDDLTADVAVGYLINPDGEKKMIKAFESITEKSALEMMDRVKSIFEDKK